MSSRESVHKRLLGWLPVEMQDCLGRLRRYRILGQRGTGNSLIAMVDGTTFHGGLCDRWKGIVSLYAYCKAVRRDFRIHYTFPFDLSQLQIPNRYDWRIAESDICRNFFGCRMLRLTGDATLRRVHHLPQDRQIHAYANRDWLPLINAAYGTAYEWGSLFKELFRPSALLQQRLDAFAAHTAHPYVAVAFRMQNLLGDYPEYAYQPASPERQRELLQLVISWLLRLHDMANLPILVTSDSERLTREVACLDFVFTNTGRAAHVDTLAGQPLEQYMKSVVDFYLLAGAAKVYAVGTKEMYPSDFPRYAALLGGVPFERILIQEDK